MAKKKNKLTLIKGVEGWALYLNDYRIVGPKPWGGVPIVKEWTLTTEQVKDIKDKLL